MTRIGSVTIDQRSADYIITPVQEREVIENGKSVVAVFRYEQHLFRDDRPIVPGNVYCSTHIRFRRVA